MPAISSHQALQTTSLLRHADPPRKGSHLYLILSEEKERKSTFLSYWENMGLPVGIKRSQKKVEKHNVRRVEQPKHSGAGKGSTQKWMEPVILSGKEVRKREMAIFSLGIILRSK